jgi:hypothetical protein
MAEPVPAVPLVGQVNAWGFVVAVATGVGIIVGRAVGETGGVLPPPPLHAARSSEAETTSTAAGAILMPVMVIHRSDADPDRVRIRRVDLARCGMGRAVQQRGEDSYGSHWGCHSLLVREDNAVGRHSFVKGDRPYNESKFRRVPPARRNGQAILRMSVAQDDPVGDERALTVVAGDRDALIDRRGFAARQDLRSRFEVDHLDHAVTARDLEPEGLERGDGSHDNVARVVAALLPPGLPLAVLLAVHNLGRGGQRRRAERRGKQTQGQK